MKEDIKCFARELCGLLKKHNLSDFNGEFSLFGPSYERYKFHWETGRHKEESGKIQIHYEERHTEIIDERPEVTR